MSTNKNPLLSSITSKKKLWLRIDNCTDEINEPISITFDDNDSVDDLKEKILKELSSTRWRQFNDKASIALGYYEYNDTPTKVQRRRTSSPPVSQSQQKLKFQSGPFQSNDKITLQQPIPTSKSNMSLTSNMLSPENTETSPRRALSTSPQVPVSSTNIPLLRFHSASPSINIRSKSQRHKARHNHKHNNSNNHYYPSPTGSSFPSSSSSSSLSSQYHHHTRTAININNNDSHRHSNPASLYAYNHHHNHNYTFHPKNIHNNSYSRPLNRTPELQTDHPISRVIFDPEEKIIAIYTELFGPMGSQHSSDPLFIFSNQLENPTPKEEEEEREEEDLKEKSVDTVEPTINNNEDNEIVYGDESDQNSRNTPFNDNEDEVEQGKNFVNIHDTEARDYELITNEEQLRRVSETMVGGADNNPDTPKQAILLLPKGYHSDVSFKEKTVPPTPTPTPRAEVETEHTLVSPLDNNDTFDDSSPIQQHPLMEQEVGLLHPMLENEWRKTGLLSPISPLMAGSITPHYSNSYSNLSHDALLSGITTTSEKVFPKINVLIVEDNVINQAILGSFLRKHKISYKVAKNGKEAVDIWKEGGLHLIFMDLQLPVLSGIEAARQIRAFEKENGIGIQEHSNSLKKNKTKAPVIIVALTASNSQDDKRNALISGCNDYLTKPVNLHWLSKKITEWGCMQALIDFDSWKQGQSRMTDSVIAKSPHKINPKVNKSTASIFNSMDKDESKVYSNSNNGSNNKIHEKHKSVPSIIVDTNYRE
ncbi:hypothetical protein NCAS_0D02900 [Naumovozyma castellii]|uniref:Response regulatory domain-containing protein n=1 Tax=Naumovozyma castellii TaxID=27288 RepID=G0VE80_NAUCA|nr:hypothetical protein NCAS_0D02900 [Naumovozyma castellii CBS 4309]CCC69871.1 hypothetical protein NCAS_0D02900 [Naumovozyma castellii CBS 4309]